MPPNDDEPERRPIGELLRGLEMVPLEEGATPIMAFVVVKYLDADGEATWAFRATSAPNKEELLGELQVQCDLLRRSLVREWEADDGDD